MVKRQNWIKPWAAAYINALTNETPDSGVKAVEEGLALLTILVPLVKGIPGRVAGTAQAKRLEAWITASAEKAAFRGAAAGKTARFLGLIIRKNLFAQIDPVLAEIRGILNSMKGILPVFVESFLPLDEETGKSLVEGIKKYTGARELALESRLNPELLGGYRIRIGHEVIDASLASQLRKMAAALAAFPAGEVSSGGF
jgi:F-type H+-transporting ATPase subunit delta